MADPRELFPILDDDGAGVAPKKMVEGDDPTDANGLIGFSFKDSDGDVVLPQLTTSGQIPVSVASPGTRKKARGELAAGSLAAFADITNAEITLTGGVAGLDIKADVNCIHTSIIQLIYVDDADGVPVEAVIDECVVGPGQYSFKMGGEDFDQDISGGTGTQKLKLKGSNLFKASALRGTLWCVDSA